MEIDSIEQAGSLHKKAVKLMDKIKNNQTLEQVDKDDLLTILSLVSYEFFEVSQES
jgi:hypothetical protein